MLATGGDGTVRASVVGSEAGASRLPEPWLSVERLPLKPPKFARPATAATPIVTPMTGTIPEEPESEPKIRRMTVAVDITVVVYGELS